MHWRDRHGSRRDTSSRSRRAGTASCSRTRRAARSRRRRTQEDRPDEPAAQSAPSPTAVERRRRRRRARCAGGGGGRLVARTRLGALRRFAFAITALNVVGHTWLGFEQSWAQPLVALATAYASSSSRDDRRARARRAPRFRGGLAALRRLPAARAHHRAGDRAAAVPRRAAGADRLRGGRRGGSKAIFRAPSGTEAAPPLLEPVELRHRGDAPPLPVGRHRAALSLHRERLRLGDWIVARFILICRARFLNGR